MKTLATAAAVLLAGMGTIALAQQGSAPGAPAPAGQERTRPEARGLSQDDFNRFLDARIAAIKAGLRLSADQDRLWAPVETAIRSAASDRFEQRRNARDDQQSLDLMQRLERRSTRLSEAAQRSAALTAALRPLWDSFSEDQKRIAPRLLRPAMAGDMGGRGWRFGEGRGRDGGPGRMGEMMHRGPGMMGRGAPGEPPRQP